MATKDVGGESPALKRTIEVVKDYAIVTYPMMCGVALLVLGLIFQATGNYIEAGVSAAIGLIVCLITAVVYVIFWLLGRYGH